MNETYYQRNKEKLKLYYKKRYQENKKEILKKYKEKYQQNKVEIKKKYQQNKGEIQKKYYLNFSKPEEISRRKKRQTKMEETIICTCGVDILRGSLWRHKKTEIHKYDLEQLRI
jgi:hypothetical protein